MKNYHDDALDKNTKNFKIIENLETVNEEKADKIELLESSLKSLMDEKELLEAFIDSKQNPTFVDFKTTSHSTPDTKPPLNQQTPRSKTSTIFTASTK